MSASRPITRLSIAVSMISRTNPQHGRASAEPSSDTPVFVLSQSYQASSSLSLHQFYAGGGFSVLMLEPAIKKTARKRSEFREETRQDTFKNLLKIHYCVNRNFDIGRMRLKDL